MSSLYIESKKDGYVHRIAAERKIGRKLKSKEIVHHIDGNKKNNSLDNLMVFNSRAAHISYHNGGKLIDLRDGTFDCESIKPKCLICHKTLDYKNKSGYCKKCYNIKRRKVVNRPSVDELIKLLEENSFCAVGRMYGVSDNAIRKWLK